MAILSPTSSNYERLEGGMGPSRLKGKRFAWKKFAIGAAVLLSLVYLLGPREPRSLWPEKQKTPVLDDTETPPRPVTTGHTVPPIQDDKPPKQPPPNHDTVPTQHPTSFETDRDPSSTTYCTTKHPSATRLVQYALMIDAGSTGSRIHVYKFNNCEASPSYEYEVFKMTQPGLSSYAGKPDEAAKSLDVLMQEALRVVPTSLHKCTPVAVKATAGLRLLGEEQSGAILTAVASHLRTTYPFALKDVVVMDGKDEGVYAWITANYLLGTIDSAKDSFAVLDLGGASTQIVFEPSFTKEGDRLVDGEHKYDLEFGGKKHVLYQHSYLGYGLMRARKHTHQLVDFVSNIRGPTSGSVVGNPCLARRTRKVVDVDDRKVTMDGEDVGSYEACNRLIELVMAKDAICEVKPCSFNGVYQPSLLDSFPTGKVLLLSYFFDRIDPFLSASEKKEPLEISTIASLATSVCLGRQEWLERWGRTPKLMAELEDRPEWCLDLTFMHALLRLGYEFDAHREVRIGKRIEGTELGWCLGATIAMVGGELTCRE